MDRRRFLLQLGAGGAALATAPALEGLVARMLVGSDRSAARAAVARHPGYGRLTPAGPELALPPGFRYVVVGREGAPMSDGRPTPGAHDGMAAFPRPGGVRLVRNHEVTDRPPTATPLGDPALGYDPRGGGGTTTLDLAIGADGAPRLERDFVSLGGTIVNCAGGPTPWGTWLSCEESTEGPRHGWAKPHGYVFEVPVAAERQIAAEPLAALGRFKHEACAVDPATGIVYLTEDMPHAGLYRFLPSEPGRLAAGGKLEMLAVRERPGLDARRGLSRGRVGTVRWVAIPDPDPDHAEVLGSAVFAQGYDRGGASFSRLEGCWFGSGAVFFHATDGGEARCGQVWRYRPAADGGALDLVFESPGRDVLDGPDNITVSPRGGLLLCEDGEGEQHLRGLTPAGEILDFARNRAHDGEFAGATYSPDGRVLFVNIQGDRASGGRGRSSMTLAIWGPWGSGPL